jgi:hypothetical protein
VGGYGAGDEPRGLEELIAAEGMEMSQ